MQRLLGANPSVPLEAMTQDEIDRHVDSLRVSIKTKANYRSQIQRFFRYLAERRISPAPVPAASVCDAV